MQFMRKRRRRRWIQNSQLLASRIAKLRVLLSPLALGSQEQFLRSPKASLSGLTPVQALRRGLVAGVMTAARGFLERWASPHPAQRPAFVRKHELTAMRCAQAPEPRIRNHKPSLLVHLRVVDGVVSGAGNEPWMSIQ